MEILFTVCLLSVFAGVGIFYFKKQENKHKKEKQELTKKFSQTLSAIKDLKGLIDSNGRAIKENEAKIEENEDVCLDLIEKNEKDLETSLEIMAENEAKIEENEDVCLDLIEEIEDKDNNDDNDDNEDE